jgi:hypothetical protein
MKISVVTEKQARQMQVICKRVANGQKIYLF